MEILHEINLARFWRLFKDYQKVFYATWLLVGAWALMIGFSIPKTYKSDVKLAPETSNNNMGAMGSLSSMMGLKLGNMTSEDAILPTLYPDVVESPDFLLEILKIKVRTKEGNVKDVDYKTYLAKYCKAPWWDAAKMAIGRALVPHKDEQSVVPSQGTKGVIMLSRKDGETLNAVSKFITCEVDKKTDVITISVTDQDPLVATILVDSVSNRLQDFITDYRTKKARVEVAHLQQLFDKAGKDYRHAQQVYAAYSDAHTDVVLNEYKVKLEDLENEVQLKYNVYSQLMVQLKAAESKVQERTPVYTVLQAPMVPYRQIAPKKATILMAYLVLATFVCFVAVYYHDRKHRLKVSEESSESVSSSTSGEVSE